MLPFPLFAQRILHWRITCLSVPSRLPDFDSSARCRGSRSRDSIKSEIVHSNEPLLLLRAYLADVKRRHQDHIVDRIYIRVSIDSFFTVFFLRSYA